MIYVSYQIEAPFGRSDYSDYVSALQLEISGFNAVGNMMQLSITAMNGGRP